jgi:hypothetical protein
VCIGIIIPGGLGKKDYKAADDVGQASLRPFDSNEVLDKRRFH